MGVHCTVASNLRGWALAGICPCWYPGRGRARKPISPRIQRTMTLENDCLVGLGSPSPPVIPTVYVCWRHLRWTPSAPLKDIVQCCSLQSPAVCQTPSAASPANWKCTSSGISFPPPTGPQPTTTLFCFSLFRFHKSVSSHSICLSLTYLSQQNAFKAYPCCKLEKEIATHSSILAWKTPWTEEPGRCQSTRSPRAGHY